MQDVYKRQVVLHPEFVNGKYALYTRPQDGFIDAGSGGGIGLGHAVHQCPADSTSASRINESVLRSGV